MIDHEDALQRCVGDAEIFAAQHWGRLPLLHRTDDRMEDLLTIDDVDTLLVSAARRPEVRVVRDGRTLPESEYCRTVRLGGRPVDGVIDPDLLADRFQAGATIVLQSLHRTNPAVGRFAAELEHLLSHPVQVNAYLTPPGAAGLRPHADGHDVIVRQLHGTKHWNVDGLGDIELEPGDVLYLPTGTEHSARTSGDASLHLTIGILRVTYAAVVRRLLERHTALDAPLPLGWATPGPSADVAASIRDVLGSAAAWLAEADAGEVLSRETARRRTRPDERGRIAALVRGAGLGLGSVVRLRTGSHPRLVESDDPGTVRLDLGGRVLVLPAIARVPVDKLLAADMVRVRDLPGVDEESRVVLARRLVAEGMLEVVPPSD